MDVLSDDAFRPGKVTGGKMVQVVLSCSYFQVWTVRIEVSKMGFQTPFREARKHGLQCENPLVSASGFVFCSL